MSRTSKRAVLIVAVVVIGLTVAAFVFDRYALSTTYARTPDRAVSLLPTYELYEKDHPRTDEQFQLDGYTLRGHVYGADNNRGLIVFHHGIFSKHSDYLPMIMAMVDKGWRVFAYDAIGCGESDGDSVLGMSQSPIDIAAALDYVEERGMADGLPVVLWGHSWGGYGVAAALARTDGVSACVSMSGYDEPMKILDHSITSSYGPIGKIQWPLIWLNTYIDFGNAANVSASDAILSSGVPTLVIQGTGDTTVPSDTTSILGTLQEHGFEAGEIGDGKTPAADAIVLKTISTPGRNGHNSYFYSPESKNYLDECAETLQNMLDENGDDATAPEVKAFLDSVDLKKANTADPTLIDEIDAFLTTHVKAN